MKIAVLISGFSKTSYFCLEYNIINIIKKLDCDVFMYKKGCNQLYSRSKYINLSFAPIETEIELYETMLGKHLKKLYISKEDTNEYKEELNFYINNSKMSNINKKQIFDQYLRLKKVCEMMIEYEHVNNFKYDYVIRMRFDILNMFELDLNMLNKNITLFSKLVNAKKEIWFTKDCFFLGKRDYIVKICKEFVSKIGLYNKPILNTDMDFCVESQFLKYVVDTFNKNDYDFVDYFVVPRMIKIKLENHKWDNYKFYEYIKKDFKNAGPCIELYVACLNVCQYSKYIETKHIAISEEELQILYDKNDKYNMIKYLEV